MPRFFEFKVKDICLDKRNVTEEIGCENVTSVLSVTEMRKDSAYISVSYAVTNDNAMPFLREMLFPCTCILVASASITLITTVDLR